MDWDIIRTVGDIGISGLALIISIGSAMRRDRDEKIEKQANEHDALVLRVSAIDVRVIGIEREIRHLPDKEVTHRMEMGIERLTGKLEAMDERFKPVAATLNRIQDALEKERT